MVSAGSMRQTWPREAICEHEKLDVDVWISTRVWQNLAWNAMQSRDLQRRLAGLSYLFYVGWRRNWGVASLGPYAVSKFFDVGSIIGTFLFSTPWLLHPDSRKKWGTTLWTEHTKLKIGFSKNYFNPGMNPYESQFENFNKKGTSNMRKSWFFKNKHF